MKNILICWVGNTDLSAPESYQNIGLGPIAQAAKDRSYDEIILLCNYPKNRVNPYLKWLKNQTTSKIIINSKKLTSPTNFGEIYECAVKTIKDTQEKHGKEAELSFHLSPGTPAMAAVWVILAKTRFPAELIESSKEHGVRTASVPFDISADFIPDLLSRPDAKLRQLSVALPPEIPEFTDLIHRSRSMQRVIAMARKIAPRSVPVLIEGESGTGKELLARAIHMASTRAEGPFVAVNCGAIPQELIESELFGHKKGAFTGAIQDRKGYFLDACDGTLFLDEIGELPLAAQVKILRVLQEEEVIPLGDTKPSKIDIRIIAATNRILVEEITAGRFREDLYYRLAAAILQLPPLREREGDVSLLIEELLEKINKESVEEPGYAHKKITAAAKNLMLKHNWPGNVRELYNTLLRAAIWSHGSVIQAEDIRDALIHITPSSTTNILDKPLGKGMNIQEIVTDVVKHYLIERLKNRMGTKQKQLS